MRTVTLGTALALLLGGATEVMAQRQPQRPAAQQRTATTKTDARVDTKNPALDKAREAEDKAIRAVADAFAKAYNAHDAKAIANLFTADGLLVDEDGDVVQGRAAIGEVFAAVIQEFPEAKMSIAIQSIRFLSPGVAIEEGTTTIVHSLNLPAEASRYSVVHVKLDGKWLMASARDLPDDATSGESQLKQLAWLIGEWVDESPDSLVMTTYRWSDDKHYILSDFTVQVTGKPVMNGSQRIGWDPLAKALRIWTFDSEGGFAEGLYGRDGNRWIVKNAGVTHDGKAASATNITTRIGKDRMTWQSRDRIVGGDAVPDIEEVTIARKPPQPM